ncbi:MAG: hypothetical protein ACJAQ7_001825, partial [Sediminicola sp.]
MKLKVVFLFIGLVLGCFSYGQIKIGDQPQNIDPASVLELQSTSRALVLTRVNNTQMNAITPLQGALVYNTETKCVHYYDGAQWLNICDALTNSVNISLENNGNGSYTFTDAVGVATTFTIATNTTFEVANDSLVLTDSNNNALSVALDSLNRHTYSTDAIVNVFTINNTTVTNDSTIVIRRTGNNYNFEVGEITGSNIQDRSIRNVDIGPTAVNGDFHIQNRSVTPIKMQPGTSGQILQTQLTGTPTPTETAVWVSKNGLFNASEISYDPTVSGLTTNTVKLALDKLALNSSDNQNLTGTPLSGTSQLQIDIENGTSATVDLSSLEESADIATLQADVDANETAANNAIALKEDAANKSDNIGLGNSALLFPTQNAVKTYVDNEITASNQTIVSADAGNDISVSLTDGGAFYDDATIQSEISNNTANISSNDTDIANNIAAIATKEDSSNKSDNIALGNSVTLFPTQNAVKAYVDNEITASNQTIVSADAGNDISVSLTDGGAFYDDATIQSEISNNTAN